MHDPPPHLPHSWIKEVAETHMLQVKEVAMSDKYGEEVWPYDIFEVFAAEKKKHQEMASKVHEPTVPLKQASTSVTDFHPSSPNSQFRY